MGLPIRKKTMIETGRLIIKPYSMEDVDGLVNLLIHPDYQGQGYATEAVRVILSELREMGFHEAILLLLIRFVGNPTYYYL